MSVYDYSYQSMEGKKVSLREYAGKVLVLVNTASKCGFTPQYEGLEKLYRKYRDQGLVVVGFPCNQFYQQEPGTNEEVQSFCKLRYGVTFPLSQKIEVRGENAHPLYRYLTSNTKFQGIGDKPEHQDFGKLLQKLYGKDVNDSSIKWNFTKFLIGRDGAVLGRYEPTVTPEELDKVIEAAL